MAKVVLVWNEHPTEVVAGFHARKVAKILKEKYGHEVVMEKIPVAETNYGTITSRKRPKKRVDALEKLRPSLNIARQLSAKHDAITFNFHCSPAKSFNPHQIAIVSLEQPHRPNFVSAFTQFKYYDKKTGQ